MSFLDLINTRQFREARAFPGLWRKAVVDRVLGAPPSPGGNRHHRAQRPSERAGNLALRAWKTIAARDGGAPRPTSARPCDFALGKIVLALVCAVTIAHAGEEWRPALAGWTYEFPRDHLPHPEFKTEWWYFTGNVADARGRRFGYQLTFFRQGLRPPSAEPAPASRFVVGDLKFAHFALTDVGEKRFRFGQKISRGAFNEAGFNAKEPDGTTRLAWIEEWSLALDAAGGFVVSAAHAGVQLALTLKPGKPWTIHGREGISQKADGAGRASHYYSGTRLESRGKVTVDGQEFVVTGESWFDHEWATNQLTPEQIGWDWFSLQFDDGTELMLYRMRTRDGGIDPNSSGTFIAKDGAVQHLTREDYRLTPLKTWKSGETGGSYPIAWQLAVPSLGLTARIETPVREQELVLQPIAYWEGVIDISGTRGERPVRGHGYMEMTGYAGELVGLSSER